jgi:hypothetical protein
MPYCAEQDIPTEAKNLRMFKLIKDFDKMLRYIHNGGKSATVVDRAKSLLGPQPGRGYLYMTERGNPLRAAMEKAELDLRKVCTCKKPDVKQSNDDVERTGCLTKLMTSFEEWNECERNIHNSVSTDRLLVIPEPLNVELSFSLDDLDLTGAGQIDLKPPKNNEDLHLGFDLSTMEL